MVAGSTAVAEGVEGVEVLLVDDRAGTETAVRVEADLAALFAYSQAWCRGVGRESVDLSFSSMLAAMVGHEQPLSRWLAGFFDRLGVDRSDIVGATSYAGAARAPSSGSRARLVTTYSFRTAWAKAVEVRDLASPGRPVATRHFMAAYAVSPAYHAEDFRRYRIDRREWCLELVEELSLRFPDEADGWAAYAAMAPPLVRLEFDDDTPAGRDRMHLKREVESIARLVASRSTSTPLSIAVFGAWGSGKSFFLQRLRDGVGQLAREAAAGPPADTEFHSRIAQVEFNAWHYSESSLVASLVAHIFRNLRLDAVDDDEQELQRRATALMLQVHEKDRALSGAGARYEAAVVNHREAEVELERLQAELPERRLAAERELTAARVAEARAQAALDAVHRRRDEALEAARRAAIATSLVADAADSATAGTVGSTVRELSGLLADVRSLRARRRPLLLGAALLAAGAIFVLVAGSEIWGRVLAVIGAIGACAGLARAWLTKLDRMAALGEELDASATALVGDAAARIDREYGADIAQLEAELEQAQAAHVGAQEQLRQVSSTAAASATLEAQEHELVAAREGVARAERELTDARGVLDALSIDSLLHEFLDERVASGTYESELGLLSQVRTDFERLSRLIARANADHVERGGPAPTVSRIVLYIDDLDRCPEPVVVRVIQAVHLLLAFPLFVCVVAADPRWLTTCLQQAPGIRGVRAGGGGDEAFELEFGRPADPADYIEKIFQVPIWLRPIPVERRAGLLRSWLGPTPGAGGVARTGVSDEELEFLSVLAERLDGKPRTLKRLANTYRLVKAGLSDVASSTFLVDRLAPNPDGSVHRPYRTCLTLLTVLSADRDEAIRMAQRLDTTNAATVDGWLADLETVDPGLTAFLRTAFGHAGLVDLAELRGWLERTRRYSFYL